MNSGSPGSNGHRRTSRRLASHDRLDEWRRLLVQCGHKPTKKLVHALRVVTLRILAQLEYQIGVSGKDSAETAAAMRWIRMGEKLRQTLGPVREADVWLDKLTALRESLSDTNGFSLRSNKDCVRQIRELRDRLKGKRKQWEKKLTAEIESRREKLEELARQIELEPHETAAEGNAGSAQIAEQFAHVIQQFPSLDAGNLHEFRKSIKKVRYMAEIFAAQDPGAGRQASAIRKMQSAIGEWHDWQALAKRESEAHGRREALAELLETLAVEALEKALATCERLTASLLKGTEEVHRLPNQSPKKSPLHDDAGSAATDLVRSA